MRPVTSISHHLFVAAVAQQKTGPRQRVFGGPAPEDQDSEAVNIPLTLLEAVRPAHRSGVRALRVSSGARISGLGRVAKRQIVITPKFFFFIGLLRYRGRKVFLVRENFFCTRCGHSKGRNRNFLFISNPAFWHASRLADQSVVRPWGWPRKARASEIENVTINRIGEMLCRCGTRTGVFNHRPCCPKGFGSDNQPHGDEPAHRGRSLAGGVGLFVVQGAAVPRATARLVFACR